MKKITTFLFGIFCMLSVANAQDITVFDFDGVTPTFSSWSDTFEPVANPVSDAVNSSANVGKYTHITQYSTVGISVDVDTKIYNSFKMKVYSPADGSIYVSFNNASDKSVDSYNFNVTVSAGWNTITHKIISTQIVKSVIIGFGNVPTNDERDVVYLDDMIFIKNLSGDVSLYAENFYASWSEWGTWTGAPSTAAGQWKGLIDLQTAGDANMTLNRDWDNYAHNLKFATSDAPVIIPDINVSGYNNLILSFENVWPWSDTDHDAFLAGANDQKLPVVEIKSGSGSWTALTGINPFTDAWTTQTLTLPNVDNTQPISIRFSPNALFSVKIDNVVLTGRSVVSSVISNLEQPFGIYPNPATKYISTPNAQKVTVCDLNGRIVKESFNAEKVDVSSLAKGTYIVKVKIDNVTKIGKLIKE